MILTDGVHLVSDRSLTELHKFASNIGLKRWWFRRMRHPHYDLPAAWRSGRAEEAGAQRVSSRELVRRMCR